MINVCDEINCPFANVRPSAGRSSGCTRYSISNGCHLMAFELNFRKILSPNQYWLFANEGDIDVASVKQYNDEFVANDESSQRQLEFELWIGEPSQP